MKYNTEKHKPMMIQLKVKEKLDIIKKDMIIKNINDGGTGRISYNDVIDYLIEKNK